MSLKNRDNILDELHRYHINISTREIFLHSYIDDTESEAGIDYRVSTGFIKNIRLLEHLDNAKPIIIHQHSCGGDWFAGMAIFDAIQTSPAPVILITHGIAASMGSIIPQAADLIVSMPNCSWIIHHGSSWAEGNFTFKQSLSWTEDGKKAADKMLDIFIESCRNGMRFEGKTDTYIRNAINKRLDRTEDWILSANEAMEYGFCNAIFGSTNYSNLTEIIKNVY